MKKNIRCNKCGNYYDNHLEECPVCEVKNEEYPLDKKFSRMVFLTDYKEFLLFLIGFLGLLVYVSLISLGLQNFKMEDALRNSLIYLIGYLLTVATMMCVIFYDLKKIIEKAKTWRSLIAALIGAAIIIVFDLVYSAILKACNITVIDSENQKAVLAVVKGYPAIAFFFVVIFGPVAEEFAYRFGLFSILRKRNKYLAYAVTIVAFTLIHFSFTSKNLANECLNLPKYIVPGFVLCVLYEYEGVNASIYAHVINNLVSFILVLAQ